MRRLERLSMTRARAALECGRAANARLRRRHSGLLRYPGLVQRPPRFVFIVFHGRLRSCPPLKEHETLVRRQRQSNARWKRTALSDSPGALTQLLRARSAAPPRASGAWRGMPIVTGLADVSKAIGSRQVLSVRRSGHDARGNTPVRATQSSRSVRSRLSARETSGSGPRVQRDQARTRRGGRRSRGVVSEVIGAVDERVRMSMALDPRVLSVRRLRLTPDREDARTEPGVNQPASAAAMRRRRIVAFKGQSTGTASGVYQRRILQLVQPLKTLARPRQAYRQHPRSRPATSTAHATAAFSPDTGSSLRRARHVASERMAWHRADDRQHERWQQESSMTPVRRVQGRDESRTHVGSSDTGNRVPMSRTHVGSSDTGNRVPMVLRNADVSGSRDRQPPTSALESFATSNSGQSTLQPYGDSSDHHPYGDSSDHHPLIDATTTAVCERLVPLLRATVLSEDTVERLSYAVAAEIGRRDSAERHRRAGGR